MVCQIGLLHPRMTSSPTAPPSSSTSNLPSDPSNKSDNDINMGHVFIIVFSNAVALFGLLCLIRWTTEAYLSRRIRHLRQTTPLRSEAEIATLCKWKDTYTWFPICSLGFVVFDIARRVGRVYMRRVVDMVGEVQLMLGRWRMLRTTPKVWRGIRAAEVDLEAQARGRGCDVCGRS